MHPLEVRLLGGFEVRVRGRLVTAFESRKVRALLAYIILNAQRPALHRTRLAALLWPDQDDESARRNLRQAVYNLRSALGDADDDSDTSFLTVTRHTVSFNRKADYFLDVAAFETLIRQPDGRGLDAAAVAAALQLYRGDLLSGSLPEGSPELEQWAIFEQERLREAALTALDRLVEHHESRGEHAHGILFAQRLLDLDPLSEQAHRKLMRLYALSGRRSRALAQYESCLNLLRLELGVEPLAETTALYKTVLREEIAAQGLASEVRPICPTIPLFGRREAYGQLRQSWQSADRGWARLAVVLGETGSGKTRLVKAFIHDVSSRTQTRVLLGRCVEHTLPPLFEPLRDAVTSLVEASVTGPQRLQGLGDRMTSALATIAPELFRGGQDSAPSPPADGTRADHGVAELAAAVDQLLRRAAPDGERAILFLDDLQSADEGSVAVLAALLSRPDSGRYWVIATCNLLGLPASHPVRALLAAPGLAPRIDRVALAPLERAHLGEIARAVVGSPSDADRLAELLDRHTGGLPLAVTEWINFFAEEGSLAASGDHWMMNERVGEPLPVAPASLDELIGRRINALPESARRLLTLAAVAGQSFDAQFLAVAAGEHLQVVDYALELLLERWLVRHFPRFWYESRRERDLVLWSQGARRGRFEFAHRQIRKVAYESANAMRRRYLHRKVAAAIEQLHKPGTGRIAEMLAYHLLAGEDWAAALPCLEAAAARAAAIGLPATAVMNLDQADLCLDRLGAGAPAGSRERISGMRQRVGGPVTVRRRREKSQDRRAAGASVAVSLAAPEPGR